MSKPPVLFHTLTAGDALGAGMTIRALVHEGRVPSGAVPTMSRVADWMIGAANSLPPKPYETGSTKLRASELVTVAMNAAAQDSLDALQAMVTAAGSLAMRTVMPVSALQLAIEALIEMQQNCAEMPPAPHPPGEVH